MHISSLPSPYGIGSFGEDARRWLDFIHDAGQSFWQILPLGPTGKGDSPYQSFSAFAGNPYFIDLDTLCTQGLLETSEYANIRWGRTPKQTDYNKVYLNREKVLRKAYSRFGDCDAIDGFIANNHWFEQYALFLILKKEHGLKPWMEWEEPARTRQPDALSKIKEKFLEDFRYHAFVQLQFERQWKALRTYAKSKEIEIIGDIPIYVSLDSADVWSNPELFQLDKSGFPTEISGTPPDSFSADGQLWGNPLYDWEILKKTDYRWWMSRLKSCFELYDVLRLDHFRGLESYFAIPYGASSAIGGSWKPGPGKEFIDAIKNSFPDARLIAEDLGFLTNEVRELLEYSGYPGMKILQYAFDVREVGDYIPYKYGTNSVAYTGTHDDDTAKGWCKDAPGVCIREAMEYTNVRRKSRLTEAMVRLALQSASSLAVIPMQDWLGLSSEGRMNTPATIGGDNWKWRIRKKDISNKLSAHMAKLTALYGR